MSRDLDCCARITWSRGLSLMFVVISWTLVLPSSSTKNRHHQPSAEADDVASPSINRRVEADQKITASSADFRYIAELAGYSCSSSVDDCVFDIETHQGSSSDSEPLEHSDDDDLDELDEERPCFVAGRVEITQNWYGYIGIFRLGSSSQESMPELQEDTSKDRSSGDAKVASSAKQPDHVTRHLQQRPPRLYYRFAYTITDVRCCRSMSVLLYNEDQFDKLRARMNCVQRLAVVLNPASTLASLSADQQHKYLSNHQQIIPLGEDAPSTSGCTNTSDVSGTKSFVVCEGGREFRSDTERSWYIAVSNCGSPSGIVLDYALLVYGSTGDCPNGNGNSTNDRRMMSKDGRQYPDVSDSCALTLSMCMLASMAAVTCTVLHLLTMF